MNANESASRKIEWGPWIMIVFGGALFLVGAGRFVLRHHFGFGDALRCCLAVLPAGLLLLVFDYVVHHARLASVIPLVAGGMLVASSPAFDVALGLVLMGVVASSALGDWKDRNRQGKSTTTPGGENKESK